MACISTFPVSPVFFWNQTYETVSFYLILDKFRKTNAVFTGKNFLFEATNKKGNKNFKVEFDLFDNWSSINRQEPTSTKIIFNIVKQTGGWWPRLLLTEEKGSCLIVDYDTWGFPFDDYDDYSDSESDSDDEEDDPFKQPMTTRTAEILENVIVHKKELMF
uniref:CS domain-containing protein n=1 Tax=Panagrolaimus sp. PS1159 TaxID=55785 RepID=A0AC35G787_9BILA